MRNTIAVLLGLAFVASAALAADNIDLPFADDPAVIGTWRSVDFVASPNEFVPGQKQWTGDLTLTQLVFLADGKMPEAWWTWTKGVLIHHGDKTASRYDVRELNGVPYMFLEWKNADVIAGREVPSWYVLKKQMSAKDVVEAEARVERELARKQAEIEAKQKEVDKLQAELAAKQKELETRQAAISELQKKMSETTGVPPPK